MNTQQMQSIVEQYCRNSTTEQDGIKVTQIARQKTVFVEQSGENGRAIMLTEFRVDGATYWAGYSQRSETVYISPAI